MVVVVNGLLSNGRLPHAYYYKRPACREVEPFLRGSGSWEPPTQPASEPATRVAGRTGLAWGIARRIARL